MSQIKTYAILPPAYVEYDPLAPAVAARVGTLIEAAAPWGGVASKIGKLFPVAILGLFGSGAYMTSDVWTWDSGWIVVGMLYPFVVSHVPTAIPESLFRVTNW